MQTVLSGICHLLPGVLRAPITRPLRIQFRTVSGVGFPGNMAATSGGENHFSTFSPLFVSFMSARLVSLLHFCNLLLRLILSRARLRSMASLKQQTRAGYSADEAIGITINDLMFRNKVTRKQLAKALGLSSQAVSRKVLGQVGWSVTDLFVVADFFNLEPADLLPRRVDAPVENEESPSEEGDSKKMVAGAGFEPTTSGL